MTLEKHSTDTKLKEVLNSERDGLLVTLRASADGLKLFADCSLVDGVSASSMNAEKIEATLLSIVTSVTSLDLIDHDIIKNIAHEIRQGQDVKIRRVARGRDPSAGKDGRVLLLVKPYDPSKVNNDSRSTNSKIRLFDNIEIKTVVARVYNPEIGKDGIDIFGKTIAAIPGKEAKLTFDDSLELVTTNSVLGFKELVAKKTGYLEVKGEKLLIKQKLIVEKDVDFKCGNIDFVGDVEIAGSVLKNFFVKARGNVVVKGDVAQGTVHSTAGNIAITGNAIGEPHAAVYVSSFASSQMIDSLAKQALAQLKSAGTFGSALLDGVTLESRGDVRVIKEIRNSTVRCQRTLYLPQGALVGGSTYVVCGLEAKVIGSASGVRTKIILSSSLDSTFEFRELQNKLREHESAEKLIRLYLGPFAEDQSGIKKLSSSHQEKILGLLDKFNNIITSKTVLEQELEQMQLNQQYSAVFRVNFLDALYPGTEIEANEQIFTTDTKIEGKKTVEYSPQEKTFTISVYKPIECNMDKSKGDHERCT